tara:strand:- start:897 stop:1640 length:744 start_codon:yes stop_codon:yes gene_type:complete
MASYRLLFQSLMLTVFVFGSGLNLRGQMFSVENQVKERRVFSSSVHLGYSDVNFKYVGDNPAIKDNPDQSLSMEPSLLHVQYNTPSVSIQLIGGNTIIGNENESLVRLGVELGTQSYLLRKKRLQIIIPFRVETAITAATKEGYGQRFYQTAFSGGFGGIIAMKPTNFFSIYTEATKWYGFSNSAGNFFGGNTDQFKTKTTIHLNRLIRGRGVYFSYENLLQNFNISGIDFDYESRVFLFSIGIDIQ